MAAARGVGHNEAGSLDIKDVVSPSGHTVVLDGELDITTAGELQPLVVRLCAGGARHVALDLSRLRFIDSTGLQAILSAHSVCRDHGTGFMLTSPQETVRRVFEITGMLDVLPFGA
ncbi:MAG TPA: STAS domain-containing protein [Solirubrobacteraceae bacterium]|jgi:anti-anti-sigma factor|nr:STAS domain-containing protein [Solirubrobacteraceae bacterium]